MPVIGIAPSRLLGQGVRLFHERHRVVGVAPMGDEDLLDNVQEDIEEVVSRLVATIESDPAALLVLQEVVGTAYGIDGARAGESFRASGGVGILVKLLAWWNMMAPTDEHLPEIAELRLVALELIGNLCSDAVDFHSSATKRELLEASGDLPLLACLHLEDVDLLRLACGALQNLCQDISWCGVVLANGAHRELERLALHTDNAIVRYASGSLRNMQVVLQSVGQPPPDISRTAVEAVAQRQQSAAVDAFRRRHALGRIKAAARRMAPEARQRRVETTESSVMVAQVSPSSRRRQQRPQGLLSPAPTLTADSANRSHSQAQSQSPRVLAGRREYEEESEREAEMARLQEEERRLQARLDALQAAVPATATAAAPQPRRPRTPQALRAMVAPDTPTAAASAAPAAARVPSLAPRVASVQPPLGLAPSYASAAPSYAPAVVNHAAAGTAVSGSAAGSVAAGHVGHVGSLDTSSGSLGPAVLPDDESILHAQATWLWDSHIGAWVEATGGVNNGSEEIDEIDEIEEVLQVAACEARATAEDGGSELAEEVADALADVENGRTTASIPPVEIVEADEVTDEVMDEAMDEAVNDEVEEALERSSGSQGEQLLTPAEVDAEALIAELLSRGRGARPPLSSSWRTWRAYAAARGRVRSLGREVASCYRRAILWRQMRVWVDEARRLSIGHALAKRAHAYTGGASLDLQLAWNSWLRYVGALYAEREAKTLARAEREATRLHPRVDIAEREGKWPFDGLPDSEGEGDDAGDDAGGTGAPSSARHALDTLSAEVAALEAAELLGQRALAGHLRRWRLRTERRRALAMLARRAAGHFAQASGAQGLHGWTAWCHSRAEALRLVDSARRHWMALEQMGGLANLAAAAHSKRRMRGAVERHRHALRCRLMAHTWAVWRQLTNWSPGARSRGYQGLQRVREAASAFFDRKSSVVVRRASLVSRPELAHGSQPAAPSCDVAVLSPAQHTAARSLLLASLLALTDVHVCHACHTSAAARDPA